MKIVLLLLLACWSGWATAHKPSDSYLTLTTANAQTRGQWDIALRDLDHAIGLDGNDDGQITWGELRSRQGDIAAYALGRLGVSAGDAPCTLQPGALLVDDHTDGKYAVLPFEVACPVAPESLGIDYRLFAEVDPQHRGLLRWVGETGIETTAVLIPGGGWRAFAVTTAERSSAAAFRDYVREGIHHIGIGFDHILFLLSLLLPAVLVRRLGHWRPVKSFRAAVWDAARVVTAFTLAHSVTLSLATLGYVNLPSSAVESAIAASVIWAAANNLRPGRQHHRTRLAFAFGLIHGLGFASVLRDLGLPAESRLWNLLGFNLGVEAGQMLIVALFLPVAYRLSRLPLYEPVLLKPGSALIAGMASVWLVERAFDTDLTAIWTGPQ